MHKNAVRHHRHNHSNFDLNGDLQKIKNAIYETTQDFKGRTGELIAESFDGIKDGIKKKSKSIQKNVANYTYEKPFTIIGATLLGGIILGFLMRRK